MVRNCEYNVNKKTRQSDEEVRGTHVINSGR